MFETKFVLGKDTAKVAMQYGKVLDKPELNSSIEGLFTYECRKDEFIEWHSRLDDTNIQSCLSNIAAFGTIERKFISKGKYDLDRLTLYINPRYDNSKIPFSHADLKLVVNRENGEIFNYRNILEKLLKPTDTSERINRYRLLFHREVRFWLHEMLFFVPADDIYFKALCNALNLPVDSIDPKMADTHRRYLALKNNLREII
jgi:hypothetical protein